MAAEIFADDIKESRRMRFGNWDTLVKLILAMEPRLKRSFSVENLSRTPECRLSEAECLLVADALSKILEAPLKDLRDYFKGAGGMRLSI